MNKSISIGITGILMAMVMLAAVPTVSADAILVMGVVAYEDDTEVPDGWPGYVVNLNRSYNPAPYTTEANPFGYNFDTTTEYDSENDYIRANCTSPDGKWFGEGIRRFDEAYDDVSGFAIVNVTVYEVLVEPETFTKSLPIGWNLVSLPLTPTNNSTSAVLGNDTIVYNAVMSYNTATHQFEDATTMDPGIGYFVNVTTAGTWSYSGTACTSISETLSTGLNCVGWTNETGSALPGALSSIAGSYRYVARWNTGTQSYDTYLPGVPDVFNDFDTMDRGEGYFIAATDSCMLE